jgi:hypothetical protein
MINHFILQGRLVDNVKPVTDTMAKARLVCNRGKDDKDTLFMDVVFYNNVNALGQWDASSLAQGTYFIEINGVTKKWMKK